MNTRILIPSLLGLMLCAASLHAQDTLVVSERVGKVIDSTEKVYYRIFPNEDAFAGITFVRQGNNIQAMNGDESLAVFPSGVFPLLRMYVEEFDILMEGGSEHQSIRNMRAKFEPLADASITAQIQQPEGMHMRVLVRGMVEGQTEWRQGELLWADENKIVLRPQRERAVTGWNPIAVKDIVSVEIEHGNESGPGFLIGGALGAAIGLGIGLQAGGRSNTGYHDPDVATVVFITAIGAVVAGTLGAIIGSYRSAKEESDIEIPYDYLSVLPSLRGQMYYRYGLPPDSPWRDN